MAKRIYVGNIPFTTKEEDLRTLFVDYGDVLSASVISDRETGRSRGFAFVEMEDEDATRAIEGLNNKEYNGRTLKINEARDRDSKERSRSFSRH